MPQKSFIQNRQQEEMQRLQDEIKHISTALHQRKELLNRYYEKSHYLKEPKKNNDYYSDQCEDIKKKIELTTKLTGIWIQELNYKQLKAGDLVHYTLVGKCYDTRFRVEFDCVENNTEDEESIQIAKFDIFTPENVQDELQKYLVRLSEDKSIWGFFQLLVPFSKWHKERKDTFQYFVNKYPDYAELAEECFIPYLIITNRKSKHSPIFCVSWNFDIDQVYRVEPKITVGMKIPDYFVKEDKEHLVDQTPERFEEMVAKLGIEHSLESLMQIVSA